MDKSDRDPEKNPVTVTDPKEFEELFGFEDPVPPEFKGGGVTIKTYKVYYFRHEYVGEALSGAFERVAQLDLDKTHIYLKDIQAPNMEKAYWWMQAESWSPNGEARPLIEAKGLSHTSMSMGDVLIDEEGVVWVVALFGFERVERVNHDGKQECSEKKNKIAEAKTE